MQDKCIYNCEVCGENKETDSVASNPPECCGAPMVKQESLPVCETSATAEHSRLDDIGEPCDDGRGWNPEDKK